MEICGEPGRRQAQRELGQRASDMFTANVLLA
jgi:hypothetical protein